MSGAAMTLRMRSIAIGAALLVVTLPAACADEGDQDGVVAPDASDDVVEASSSHASDAGAADAERRPEAGSCSVSKLCVVAVPIDDATGLTSVWGASATEVWAVGAKGTILHYGGNVWERADLVAQDASTSATLRSVRLERSDDVWILDGLRIRHSTGWKGPTATEWSFHSFPSANLVPAAVRGHGDTIWLARGLVAHPYEQALSRFEGWGDGGPGPEERFGPSFDLALSAVVVSRPDEVWTVGRAVLARLSSVFRAIRSPADGGPPAWSLEEHDSRSSRLLYGVGGDENVVWLVGEGGTLRRMAAGAVATRRFDEVDSPTTADLLAVYGFGPNDVWVVGEASTVLHWNGVMWTKLSTPFDETRDKPRLLAVWGSSPRDVWIAGEGTMLHFSEGP